MKRKSVPLDQVERTKRRREHVAMAILLLAIIVCVNVALKLSKASSALPFATSIFFFGIVNLNLVLLAVLVFLIARNLSKVFFERRANLLGSKLKAKLAVAFLSISIIPTIVLFLISSLYINSSFDKWFSIKVGNTLQASLEITHAYYQDHHKSAQHFAEKIRVALLSNRRIGLALKGEEFLKELENQRKNYSLAAVEVYEHPLDPRTLVTEPELARDIFPRLPIDSIRSAMAGETVTLVQHVGSGDVLRSVVPLYATDKKTRIVGAIAVNYYVPVSIVAKATEISSTFEDYKKVNPLKYPIKSMYFSILVLITLLIIFVAIWTGFYLARELTVPLERLERAVKEVGSGNLDVEFNDPGNDEIATVLRAFTKMTADIKESRNRLQSTNNELEEKRRYVEAILSNVSAGVLSINSMCELTTINKSAANLLSLNSKQVQGRKVEEIFLDQLADLNSIIQAVITGGEKETIFKYLNLLSEEGEPVSVLVNVTPLYDESSRYQGLVLVLDDITHMIKAQREAAWREVARRIAHEIKNPLTPIKLSAQRLQKRFGEGLPELEQKVFTECTGTIIRQVDELKEMVNEFSQYARFPAASPVPNDLNAAVAEVVGLYQQAHKNVRFQSRADEDIPVFAFDREQIKRVLINLLDNAVVAAFVKNKGSHIIISTRFNPRLGLVKIEVEDNGPGISSQVMPLLFEPYFSTKKEGTGLGLAIAKRIISDHDGYIRASSQIGVKGAGACFTIELPIDRAGEVIHES